MSTLDRSSHSKYDVIDTLSIEQLETLLVTLDDDKDMELILHVTGLIAEREAKKPSGRIMAPEVAWTQFKAQYRDMPEEMLTELPSDFDEVPEAQPAPKKTRRLTLLWRAASVAAVFLVTANILTFSAFGKNILQMMAYWTSDTFTFSDNTLLPYEALGLGYSARLDVDSFDSEHDFLPTWLPERFTFQDGELKEYLITKSLTLNFTDEEGGLLVIHVTKLERAYEYTNYYEKDDEVFIPFEQNHVTYHIFTNSGSVSAAWNIDDENEYFDYDYNYEFHIYGNSVTIDEMETIVKSIQ